MAHTQEAAAMANRHTATHQGFTFTRTSKGRVYSHAALAAVGGAK